MKDYPTSNGILETVYCRLKNGQTGRVQFI